MAYTMKGFTYPGKSPLRGKQKVADLAAASERAAGATEQWKDAMGKETEGTDLMKGNNPKYGEVPFQKRAPLKTGLQKLAVDMGRGMTTNTGYTGDAPPTIAAPKQSLGDSFKSALGSELGQAAGKAIIGGAVNLAVSSLANKKEKPTRSGGSASGFSNTKIGKRS